MQNIPEIKLLLKDGQKLFERGDFNGAVNRYSKALKICKATTPDKNYLIYLAEANNGVGHSLRSRAEFGKARRFQENAVKIYRKLAAQNPNLRPNLAISLHYMGDVLTDVSELNKALKCHREELKIIRGLYAKNKRKFVKYLIFALNGLAYRLADKKQYKSALSLFNESLDLQAHHFKSGKQIEKNQPTLSWTHHGIGTTLLKMGNTNGAISALEESLKIRRGISLKNKRFIGALKNTLNKLGEAHARMGNEYYRQTLKIVMGREYKNQVVSSKASTERKQLLKRLKLH